MTVNNNIEVTSGGKGRVDRAAELLAAAFEEDPAYAYFFHDVAQDQRQRGRRKVMGGFVKASVLNDGEVVEAGGWGSCGILMPPGKKAENPLTLLQSGLIPMIMSVGVSRCKRIIIDYTGTAEDLKNKALSKEESRAYWYVLLMGTAAERRNQGLASKIVVYMQDKARQDGRPLWLEASNHDSHRLFAKHGFKDAGEIILGKGIVDSDGMLKEGGEGVTAWGMVWRP